MAKLKVQKDGPYLLEGAELIDWNGAPYPHADGPIALCRCGASKKKPFCDGTHTKIGFKASESAEEVKK